MHWKLYLDYDKGRVELWDRDSLFDFREWEEKRNTSQEILLALTSIREEKKVAWSDVPEFQLELNLPTHATSRRIAETFQNTYTTFVAYE